MIVSDARPSAPAVLLPDEAVPFSAEQPVIASEASLSASAALPDRRARADRGSGERAPRNAVDATPLRPPVTEPPPREVHVPESRLMEARPAKSTQTETHPADVPRELRTLEERPTELRTVQRPATPPKPAMPVRTLFPTTIVFPR